MSSKPHSRLIKNLTYKSLFFLLAFSLPGCIKKDKEQVPGRTMAMHINLQQEPISLDPRQGFDVKSQLIIKSLFEGLTRINLQGEVYPAVAEEISVSPDGKEYLFTLRNCYWTNGEPIRASDFAYTWKGIISGQSTCTLADLFYVIKNARKAKSGEAQLDEVGITVVDEKTLRVELEHPAPYFLYLLSNPLFSPVCERVDREESEWSNKKGDYFVCNGPFRLKKLGTRETISTRKKSPIP